MENAPKQAPKVEPWLRGTLTEVPAVGRGVLHALELAFEDLKRWTAGLADTEVMDRALGLPSISFQMKHMARSVDRLLTYAEGGQLSDGQLAALKTEETGDETLAELMDEVEIAFRGAAERIRVLATADMNTARGVGRKQLPTTIGGLLVHVADHTQRHTGQAITTAKIIAALRPR